jgi:hypothetical protein
MNKRTKQTLADLGLALFGGAMWMAIVLLCGLGLAILLASCLKAWHY